jgi:hypothetical protein
MLGLDSMFPAQNAPLKLGLQLPAIYASRSAEHHRAANCAARTVHAYYAGAYPLEISSPLLFAV